MVSKSPERMTFQKEGYIKRCEEKGEEPNPDYVKMYETWLEQYDARFDAEESRKDDMEYDLLTTDWVLEKVRTNDVYAQNLYAAMCNNDFIKREMWPLLKEQKWSCSWRYAGGIIADMRQEGDYIDWYCSGIRDDYSNGYVGESVVTEEIEKDLYELGWIVVKYSGED